MAALGRLAGTGIVVRSGAALERLADVELVAFDKTGTLTHGRLNFEAMAPDDDEAFRAAAALSSNSEHPISRAIVAEAARRNIETPSVEGFSLHGRRWRFRRRLMAGHGTWEMPVICNRSAWSCPKNFLRSWAEPITYIADVERCPGLMITLADRVRDDAQECVAALKAAGVGRVVMLSGDRLSSAERIAVRGRH